MTIQNQRSAKAPIAPAGLLFLAVTSVCWGLNWPITKYVLSEWPPLPARGLTGIVGGLTLAIYALAREDLHICTPTGNSQSSRY